MANQYTTTFPERFWSKVNKTSGCWNWTARKNKHLYGEFLYNNKVWKAHRLSYLIYYGDFDLSLFVLHKCDNPSCVNPDHLFLSTQKENMMDMSKKGRAKNQTNMSISYDSWLSIRPNKSKKDLCKRGHEFSDKNTRIKISNSRILRQCRTCQYENTRKDIVLYKVKNFVRGVENRQEVISGLVDKIYSLGVKCIYCGGDFESLDHFVQKKNGGQISVENINPSCNQCNQSRKNI